MREVVASKHPIGLHGAEVLDLKLDQRAGKLGVISKVVRKSISLELVLPAQNVHQQLDDGVHGTENIREEEESNDDGMGLGETEVGIERLVVDEQGEEREDVEEVNLKS